MKKDKNPEKVTESLESIDFKRRMDGFISDLKLLKIKHRLDFNISIDFPEYKVLPDDLKLALNVISRHKLRYILGFANTEVKNDDKK